MSTQNDPHPATSERQPTPVDGTINQEDIDASLIEKSVADGTGDSGELILDEETPEEITGRATGTDESLTTLFENPDGEHMADGFKGDPENEEEEE